MSRDNEYLIDILESARIAVRHVGEKTLEEFLSDVQSQDAVIRRIEILGEAARRVSKQTREQHPGLPWPDMVKMRNVLVHEYDGIDLNIVYETVITDLPPLIETLESIIEDNA